MVHIPSTTSHCCVGISELVSTSESSPLVFVLLCGSSSLRRTHRLHVCRGVLMASGSQPWLDCVRAVNCPAAGAFFAL